MSDLDQDLIWTDFSGGGSLDNLSLLGSLEDGEINHFDRGFYVVLDIRVVVK